MFEFNTLELRINVIGDLDRALGGNAYRGPRAMGRSSWTFGKAAGAMREDENIWHVARNVIDYDLKHIQGYHRSPSNAIDARGC